MKISESWLRELINIKLDSKDLYNQITMAGFEVKDVKPVANIFSGIVVGKITNCIQWHNKNLYETQVNIGNNKLLNIICEAPNCRQGLKVAVATIGSMPNYSKIHKEPFMKSSEGILCSFYELGLSEKNNDIIELPADAEIGTDIYKYLKLKNDNIIEINVTPNRADCLSIIGIARDLSIFNKIKLKIPDIITTKVTINDILPIQVEDVNSCPRYLGRVIKDINIKKLTPLWMKEKLRRCGICPINVIVDIANYVLIELGQPIYIFDIDLIDGGIIVRKAKRKEILSLLDNNKVDLNMDTLVVADYNRVLTICGIFSSEHFNINDKTRNILLECAFFNPLTIITQANHYKFRTEATYRYERGIDPELQHKAIERATNLLLNICGGKAGPIIDITNKELLPKCSVITLRRNKLNKLIGHHISDMQVNDILCRLGCKIIKENNYWKVTTPSWRFDINIEEDLIEEIIRIYGYNNIPNVPIQITLEMKVHSEGKLSIKRVKDMLNDKGYQEVITYSFVDPKLQRLIHPNKEMLTLTNPISKEMSTMRLSLWSGLLNTIKRNQKRQQKRLRIFEAGMCFIPDNQANLGVRQEMMLAGAIFGNRYEEHWDLKKDTVDFYDVKGDIEAIFDLTGRLSEIEFRAQKILALHLGQSAGIYLHNKCVGFIGVVNPSLEYKLNLNSRTVLFELEWNKIADCIIPEANEVSRFTISRRDIAIVVADNIPAADILIECKKISENQIVNVNLFDVYRGNGVEKGYKSLAISLIIQDHSHTLEEKEITSIVNKCVKMLKKKFRASLRS